MRGPKPAHPIELTEAEVKHLRHFVQAHTSPQAQVVRAQIILDANDHPENSNQQIAAQVGTSDRQVRKWRKRSRGDPHAFRRASQWGTEAFFPRGVRAQVTALACSLPKQSQVPLTRWSRAELARRVAQDPSLPPISVSTVGRLLKEDRLHPWRYHSWQHIHDPVPFLQRALPVLDSVSAGASPLASGNLVGECR